MQLNLKKDSLIWCYVTCNFDIVLQKKKKRKDNCFVGEYIAMYNVVMLLQSQQADSADFERTTKGMWD